MSNKRRKFVAESTGTINLLTTDEEPVGYTDWSVCNALGIKRRTLVQLRQNLKRDEDWLIINGEVGMSHAWCVAKNLNTDHLTPIGQSDWVSFEAINFVLNPQLLLAKTLQDGIVYPVRVKDASAFKRGMVFEARRGYGNAWEIAYAWPRRDY